MAAYRERLADRIDKELQRQGQDHHDLAHALRINPRTAERWVTGETEPQRRYRKPLADFLQLPIEELWPELEIEDKAFREWMTRIEANQLQLLERLGRIEDSVNLLGSALFPLEGADEDVAAFFDERRRRSESPDADAEGEGPQAAQG